MCINTAACSQRSLLSSVLIRLTITIIKMSVVDSHWIFKATEMVSNRLDFCLLLQSGSLLIQREQCCRRGRQSDQQTEQTFPLMTTNLSSYIKTTDGCWQTSQETPAVVFQFEQTDASLQTVDSVSKYKPENLPDVTSTTAARLLLFESFKRLACRTSQLLWHCPLILLRPCLQAFYQCVIQRKGSKHTWSTNVRN